MIHKTSKGTGKASYLREDRSDDGWIEPVDEEHDYGGFIVCQRGHLRVKARHRASREHRPKKNNASTEESNKEPVAQSLVYKAL